VSNESSTGRSLASYVDALYAAVDDHDPSAGRRIRDLAAGRTGRIRLDDDVVLATFVAGGLAVTPDDPAVAADGQGATDRGTVMALLTGRLEAAAALLTGRVEIVGEPDAVIAILQIIEILLDAAARAPELQRLERELVAGHFVAVPSAAGSREGPGPSWYPDDISHHERALLARLDLLRDGADH
jgi:hypothetical protein